MLWRRFVIGSEAFICLQNIHMKAAPHLRSTSRICHLRLAEADFKFLRWELKVAAQVILLFLLSKNHHESTM
jgi:hypothetical protein